ncbi:MAG: hypothetical protein IJ120_03860 [Solobacterium sp.]|nr:hypothetical protein [Solobacterium sp.]
MRKKIVLVLFLAAALTACLTLLHLNSRKPAAENGITVCYNSKESIVDIRKLNLTEVSGTAVNGKGEEKTISGKGILLKDVLTYAGAETYEQAVVTADDEFSATVTAEEINGDTVYLISEEEEVQMVVFGDSDSKRRVKKVIRIEVK